VRFGWVNTVNAWWQKGLVRSAARMLRARRGRSAPSAARTSTSTAGFPAATSFPVRPTMTMRPSGHRFSRAGMMTT